MLIKYQVIFANATLSINTIIVAHSCQKKKRFRKLFLLKFFRFNLLYNFTVLFEFLFHFSCGIFRVFFASFCGLFVCFLLFFSFLGRRKTEEIEIRLYSYKLLILLFQLINQFARNTFFLKNYNIYFNKNKISKKR